MDRGGRLRLQALRKLHVVLLGGWDVLLQSIVACPKTTLTLTIQNQAHFNPSAFDCLLGHRQVRETATKLYV